MMRLTLLQAIHFLAAEAANQQSAKPLSDIYNPYQKMECRCCCCYVPFAAC
jgi:hypothetical protein